MCQREGWVPRLGRAGSHLAGGRVYVWQIFKSLSCLLLKMLFSSVWQQELFEMGSGEGGNPPIVLTGPDCRT